MNELEAKDRDDIRTERHLLAGFISRVFEVNPLHDSNNDDTNGDSHVVIRTRTEDLANHNLDVY